MIKRTTFLISMILMFVLLSGCSNMSKLSPDESQGKHMPINENFIDDLESPQSSLYAAETDLKQPSSVTLYFYDEKNNKLTAEILPLSNFNEANAPSQAIKKLISGPKSSGLSPTISSDTKLLKVETTDNILNVNLSAEFLKSNDLLIARASLVNTIMDLNDYKYVKLFIMGKELTHNGKDDGVALGLLTRYPNNIQDIIANEAKASENEDIRKVERELYFTDNQGLYLLPEVRTITITNRQYAKSIVEELIIGPYIQNQGFYPTVPKGTKLENSEVIKGQSGELDGIALYFSQEFRTQFTGGSSQELTTLGSLVYSLTTLPNVGYVKIFYNNGAGQYINEPIHGMALDKGLTINDFPNMLGKRIKAYFGDKQGMLLIPEYRAVPRENSNIASLVLAELTTEPTNPESVRVIPYEITPENIKVNVEGEKVTIDLPNKYFDINKDNEEFIRDLYAIVNSLTDPLNLCNVKEVKFTLNGSTVDLYNGISLNEPFVRNPALIKE